MSTYTRKEFLGLSAVLAGGVGCAGLPDTEAQETGARGGQQPDLALVNGRVYTINDATPQAEAFAVAQGRFIAVGSTDDIRNLARTQGMTSLREAGLKLIFDGITTIDEVVRETVLEDVE